MDELFWCCAAGDGNVFWTCVCTVGGLGVCDVCVCHRPSIRLSIKRFKMIC